MLSGKESEGSAEKGIAYFAVAFHSTVGTSNVQHTDSILKNKATFLNLYYSAATHSFEL